MEEDKSRDGLRQKYILAGKIRFISFVLLLVFLWLMKSIGGYTYLNNIFLFLIIVEAVANQPYPFIMRNVNLKRFQYYQMATDIIAISWIMHYMGGLEAPLVSIAYYAVILWAGVVSTVPAVIFAVVTASILFSTIVIFEHIGLFPLVSFFDYKIPTPQMLSLLFSNVAFFFAFGYFSAYTSRAIRTLERKQRAVAVKYTHKLQATGHLVGNAAHDIMNHLASIRGYAEILLSKMDKNSQEAGMVRDIERLENGSMEMLDKLGRFSQKPEQKYEAINVNEVISDAVELTNPLVRYSKMAIKQDLLQDMPLITADKSQLVEVFVALILNALEATSKEGELTIKTGYIVGDKAVEIIFSDTGCGMPRKYLERIADPFFTTKGADKALGLGLTISYEAVARHQGKISVKSAEGKGTTFIIRLPVMRKEIKTL